MTAASEYLTAAFHAATECQWREASRSTLLAAEFLHYREENYREKKMYLRLQIDYCMMAADFAAKDADAVDAPPPHPFNMNLHSMALSSVRLESFKDVFKRISTTEAIFRALYCAYALWFRMPDEECTEVGNILMPRIMKLLVDCRMFDDVEYYADAWIARVLSVARNFSSVTIAFHETFGLFAAAGAYRFAAKCLFKYMGTATHHQAFHRYLKESNGAFDVLQTALQWRLAILAMTIGEEAYEKEARNYLKAALSGSCAATFSKLSAADENNLKLCRHEFKTDGERFALRSTALSNVYVAAKLLALWRVLLVKRDREGVVDILQSFWNIEDENRISRCDICRSLIGDWQRVAAHPLTKTRKMGTGIVDALFARPPETLAAWLAELGVVIPDPSSVTTPVAEQLQLPSAALKSEGCHHKDCPSHSETASSSSSATATASSSHSNTTMVAIPLSTPPTAASSNANSTTPLTMIASPAVSKNWQRFCKLDPSDPSNVVSATPDTATHVMTMTVTGKGDVGTSPDHSFNGPVELGFSISIAPRQSQNSTNN